MKIGFLGDSITLGYGLEHHTKDRFSHLICTAHGWEEHNLGITGTLVARAGMSAANGTAYVDRFEALRGDDFAVIFGGTNDYFWTDTPPYPDDAGADGAYFTCALSEILTGVQAFLPKERILLVTPYPHHGIGNFLGGQSFTQSSEHDTDQPNFVGKTLSDYCDLIVDVCAREGCAVLDLREAPVPFDWRVLTMDGCHPNPTGHRWLADVIGDTIRNML